MSEGTEPSAAAVPRRTRWKGSVLWLVGITAVVLVFGLVVIRSMFEPRRPLAQLNLADGRILQIEGATYGTKHRIGYGSIIVDRFGRWMPRKLRAWLTPTVPANTLELERPGLVVWVNAIDPETGTNVDCQGIRAEFVDKHGDLFVSELHENVPLLTR